MNILNLTKKEIICNENGFVLCDYMGTNTVSFFAELPKSAVVDHIKVNGEFLEDIVANKSIVAGVNKYEKIEHNGAVCKCAMTVNFSGDIPELYEKASAYEIDRFEIYYHIEAVSEL